MKQMILEFVLAALIFGFLAALLGGALYLEIYHYKDCLTVGHTKFYCVTDIFR